MLGIQYVWSEFASRQS